MPDKPKLIIHNIDGTKTEVEPLKMWEPGDFTYPGQEDFFDAVRNDTEMTEEQKARWLSLEPNIDDGASGGGG